MSSPPPLLGPPRVRFGVDPSAPIGGAWYPYTVQLADELPGVLAAVDRRSATSPGWTSTGAASAASPGLDSPDSPMTPPLMSLTAGGGVVVTILVIPPRTASSLAAILLRQASNTVSPETQLHSLEYRRGGERILELAARAVTSSKN